MSVNWKSVPFVDYPLTKETFDRLIADVCSASELKLPPAHCLICWKVIPDAYLATGRVHAFCVGHRTKENCARLSEALQGAKS